MKIPAEHDLPAAHLNARKEHLIAEISEHSSPRRGRALLAGTAVAASAAIGIPLLLSLNAPVANAVTENADGTITVSIEDWEDEQSVQTRLRELDVSAVVAFLPGGQRCTWPGTTWTGQPNAAPVVEHGAGDATYVLYPERIEPGQTAAITFQYAESDDGEVAALATARMADGPVGNCQPKPDDSVVDPDSGVVGG